MTATFSEAVTTFAVAGVMVANGTATAVNGSGAVYTVTITPDGGSNDAITIQLIAEAGEVDNGGGRLPTESGFRYCK
ncbi:MAG: Ig-like domain-containing protein [Arenicellales bacterium WSBS_2016_MAG_OTU3]